MTEPVTNKRKKKSIEQKLAEIEKREQKLILEKEKLLEKKKEEIRKIDNKKKDILLRAFKKNVSEWDNLTTDEITLLCEELFTKYKTEINSII